MSSKCLMNNILRETSRMALIKSLQDRPSHDQIQLNATLRHVQLGVIISDSRLDDELSVATIEFHLTPQWLSQDRTGFPKYTPLGTIWRAVDRHAIDEHGRTEFMRAVMKGNSHMELLYAEMLAEFDDTDVNVQDDRGRTALHWACALFHQDMVRLCLSVPNCNTGLLDHDGLTAFDISRCSGSEDETIPNLFYRNIIEIESLEPQTALLRVLTITSEPATTLNSDKPVFPGFIMFDPVIDDNEPLVAALIARGIDFTATDNDGDTALHMAAAKPNNLGIVSKLINAGWDVNAVGNDGATPLHCAARTRDVEVVKLLLDREANVGATDHHGNTPLKLAEDIHCEDLVELLQVVPDAPTRAAPAPPSAMNQRTVQTPLPERNGRPSRGHESDVWGSDGMSALHRAARDGHTSTVLALLAGGASVDGAGVERDRPLHFAAKNGHTETVLALLAGGATVDAMNVFGRTPLHLAAEDGNAETVSALLGSGATVDASDGYGRTLLHVAAQHGHAETVSALLGSGATVDAIGGYGRTPLHVAAQYRHAETVSVLLASGASIELLEEWGMTALDIAVLIRDNETIKILRAAGAKSKLRRRFGGWTN